MYKNVTWNAEHISSAKSATDAANLNDVDVVSWWCNNNGDATVGTAYVGYLCSSLGVNLNEKMDTAMRSGYVCIDT